jgi:inner membrane protein
LDPISHALVGLAAGGFSGDGGVLSNPLALGCLIGSVMPDADIIMQYWGDYAYLKHHRGASHSLVGMAALSAAASLLIRLLFPGSSFLSIFLWTFIGCLTHVGLDIFNSYGAKLFWPFCNKKIGTGLMLSFDPILVMAATVVYWFGTANTLYTKLSVGVFAIYLLFRQYRKTSIRKAIKKIIDFPVDRLVLLPSMTSLLSWDFIAYGEQEIVTGKAGLLTKKIEIRERMNQSESWIKNLIMNTKVGRFFHEFTKEYHISFEELENGIIKATMTDLRYYINNRYMHHATVHFDQDLNPVEGLFHPYNMRRSAKVPV